MDFFAPEYGGIALVTHARHMRRAHRVFAHTGFTVLEAPTAFSTPDPVTLMSYLPNAWGLLQSRIFFHEVLGLGWYHIRLAQHGNPQVGACSREQQ